MAFPRINLTVYVGIGLLFVLVWPSFSAQTEFGSVNSEVNVPRAETKSKPIPNDLSLGKSHNDNLIIKSTSEYGQRQNAEAIKKLEQVRGLQSSNHWLEAATLLQAVAASDTSQEIKHDTKRMALLGLADYTEEKGQLELSQQYLAEYLKRFSDDPMIPEILLRQAYLYQRMGAYIRAEDKLYSVQRAAIALETVNLEYSKRITLTAQTELAETQYAQGKYVEAAGLFERLLTDGSDELNIVVIKTKLIRSLSKVPDKTPEVIRHAVDFLNTHAAAEQQAEIRYLLAQAYKALGKKQESLRQLLLLLEAAEVSNDTKLKSWKMLAGNEIGNQLFLEGDYINAITVYNGLLALDEAVSWKLPIHYQIGLCFERESQPDKAIKSYEDINALGQKTTAKLEPSLQMVVDMARFRNDILSWRKALDKSGLTPAPKEETKTQ
jgi:tetratricopeptide (TPR) repeat protein